MNTAPRINSPEGAEAILADANRGVPRAMRLAAILNVAAIQGPQDWNAGLDWLQVAAQHGDSDAESELVALSDDTDLLAEMTALTRQDRRFPEDIWRRLRAGIDLQRLLAPPTKTFGLWNDPVVMAVTEFASPQLCAWLRNRAAPSLAPSSGYEESVFTLANTGVPVMALRERIAGFFQMPYWSLPPTSVRRYAKGEGEALHFEPALPPVPMEQGGLALVSLRLYLNEDYEGGHADFPQLGVSYRGKMGHALAWSDTQPAGISDPMAQHSEMPVTKGEKWVLAQRVRSPADAA